MTPFATPFHSLPLAPEGAPIRVGQKLHCILYGGRDGYVLKVNGPQSPKSVGTLGGFVSYGGSATVDVVFDYGISRGVPECIVRGVQWRLYDECGTPDVVAAAYREAVAAECKARAEAAKREQERARERAELPAKYPHLLTKAMRPKFSPARLAAENIRRELKLVLPGVKFRVTTDGYSSVGVRWTDGPTTKQVEAITGKYERGSFNGMEDIYETNRDNTFADVFGDPNYVSESREDTDAGLAEAFRRQYPGGLSVGGKNTITAETCAQVLKGNNYDEAQAVRRAWSETDLTGFTGQE